MKDWVTRELWETYESVRIHIKKQIGMILTHDKKGNLLDGWDEAIDEIRKRSPFDEIFNEDYEDSLPALRMEVSELKEEIKKIKRHKHDEKNGDVLIRI